MLISDSERTAVDDPLGRRTGPDVVVGEKGTERMNGASTAARPAVGPIFGRRWTAPEEFHPEGEKTPCSDRFWVVFAAR